MSAVAPHSHLGAVAKNNSKQKLFQQTVLSSIPIHVFHVKRESSLVREINIELWEVENCLAECQGPARTKTYWR
jgi:hypothetical protein